MSHDPDRQAHLAASRRQGGTNKATRIRAQRELLRAGAATAPEALAFLHIMIRRAAAGRIEPALLSAISGATRTWLSGQEHLTLEALAQQVAELQLRVQTRGEAGPRDAP